MTETPRCAGTMDWPPPHCDVCGASESDLCGKGDGVAYDLRRLSREGAPDALAALVKAGERAAIGGNHLGLLLDHDHPPHTASPGYVLELYGAGGKYEIWCAWAAIYPLVAALAAVKGPTT